MAIAADDNIEKRLGFFGPSLFYVGLFAVMYSCTAASDMLLANPDLRRKWAAAVDWLHEELERVSKFYLSLTFIYLYRRNVCCFER